jgi:hypothetical protein
MSDVMELLPCPFCGGEAEADHGQPFWHYATGKTSHQAAIYCRDCTGNLTLCHDDHPGASPDDLVAELIAAWNRRAPTAPKENEG